MGELSTAVRKSLPQGSVSEYWTIKSIRKYGNYLKKPTDFYIVHFKNVGYNEFFLPSYSWLKKNEKKFRVELGVELKEIPDKIDKAITGCKDSSSLVRLKKSKMSSICKSVKSFGIKQYISRLEKYLGGKTDRRTAKLVQTATYKRCKFINESFYKPNTEYYELELERFEEGKLVPKNKLDEFVAKMKEQHPAEEENTSTSSIVLEGYETDWVDITLPRFIKKEKLGRWDLPD